MQGRSQLFCMKGFLMYIACQTDNRAPETCFTRGFRGHASPENFLILGLQKWRFRDFKHKFHKFCFCGFMFEVYGCRIG